MLTQSSDSFLFCDEELRASCSHKNTNGGWRVGLWEGHRVWPPVTSWSGMLIMELVNANDKMLRALRSWERIWEEREPPPLLHCFSQCHSVPHFKLPLLGSGHKNRLCSTCQMWDTEEPSLTSNLHFLLPAFLTRAISLFTDHLRSHFNCCNHLGFTFILIILFVCIHPAWSYALILGAVHQPAHSVLFNRQHHIQVQFVIHNSY